MEYKKRQTQFILSFAFALVFQFPQIINAQIVSTTDKADSSAPVYLDLQNGMTADEAVGLALENNGELQALRKEADAARALVKQAGLRANPKLEANGARQIGGTDNSVMIEGMLPLELGGRRAARIKVAQAEGKIDASFKAGYQRMRSGFPLNGITDAGGLQPIESVFQFFTFGVEIDLPVRNRNQGMIEAALFERQAAQKRIEFGELTIRREVNVAFARYNRAVRALTIFENGVRDQADANLRVIWQTYELGKRSLSDYIAEERRFLEIENELIDSLLKTYLARIEILRAANAAELIRKCAKKIKRKLLKSKKRKKNLRTLNKNRIANRCISRWQ